MSNANASAGKWLERLVARLVRGERFWSNSGQEWDVECDHFLIQCKHVQTLSLHALISLTEHAGARATLEGKAGALAVKWRGGHGVPSPVVFCVDAETFVKLLEAYRHANPSPSVHNGGSPPLE